MGDSINTISSSNDKIQVMDRYNSLIEKTRGRLFSGLGYEKEGTLFFNKAYFNKGQQITDEYIQKQVEESRSIISQLNDIRDQVSQETILNKAQKKLIEDFIHRTILSIEYHANAIYIEAEKGGYALSNKERIHHRKEILRIEDQLYGNPITELEPRRERTIKKLHELYFSNKHLLTQQEQESRQRNILERFPIEKPLNIPEKNGEQETTILIKEKHILELVALLLEIEGFDPEHIVKIEIDPDITAPMKTDEGIYHIPAERKSEEIYDYFDKEGRGQDFKIIKKTLGGSSVSISKENDMFKKNQIDIAPAKNERYDLRKTILPIIYDHEISTHVNTGMGNFRNIYIRDPERSDLEEGVALFNQIMTEGKDISTLYEPGISDIGMFLGENFDEHQLKDLISIYFKLTGETTKDIDDRVRRIKMGVPLGELGSRRKDLTYGNGKEILKDMENLTKTPEGIQQLNTYARAIYSTKLGYQGIQDIDNILEGITDMSNMEPNFPIFAGKIIYRKLFKGKLDKDKMLKNDLRRFITTDKKITDKQKRLLVKILHIIQQYGEKQLP